MRFIPATVLSCTFLTACSLSTPSLRSDGQRPIELPITLRHNLPTVEVHVAGVPFDLFLDLGGYSAISLTAEELAQAKVQYLPKADHYGNAMGDVFTARRFIAPDVVAGGHSFGNVEGGEYVHPSSGGPPDRNGYIGKGILTKFLLVVDYPRGRVLLYEPGDEAAFRHECGSPQFAVTDADGAISSVAYTAYGQLSFQWDTGATDNFLRPSVIGTAASAARKLDEGSPILTPVSVKLGSTEVDSLTFRLLEFSAPAVDATFGTGLFVSWKVCLDFAKGYGAIVRSSP